MNRLASLFCAAVFALALNLAPSAHAQKPTTVVVDGQQITGISDVYLATETKVCVTHEGKSDLFPIEKFRRDFLEAWGVAAEDIEKAFAETKAEIERQKAAQARMETRMKELGLSREHIGYFGEEYRKIFYEGSEDQWKAKRPEIEAAWKKYKADWEAQQAVLAEWWRNMFLWSGGDAREKPVEDDNRARKSEPSREEAIAARDYLVRAIEELKMKMMFADDVFTAMRIMELIKEHQKTLDEICRRYGLSKPGFKRLGD